MSVTNLNVVSEVKILYLKYFIAFEYLSNGNLSQN